MAYSICHIGIAGHVGIRPGFRWMVAPFRGVVEEREIINWGPYRIQAYEQFYRWQEQVNAIDPKLAGYPLEYAGLQVAPEPTLRGNPVATLPNSKWLPGQLARARNRDWVALHQDGLDQYEPDIIRLRPVDGTEAEAIGIYLPLEPNALAATEYLPPDPDRAGDFSGARLLRDALRLNLRSGAGPFRSMGRLSVEPRPYQFVPLIMGLRLDPVRLLIADDVGVGKTIETGMIARELLDRGTVRRIGVLCPPHLCEQWEEELRSKFNIEAAVIQSSRINRLERALPRNDVSIYQHYRHLVASIDFVKSDRNRQQFLANAPDLIIIDEAHTAARPAAAGKPAMPNSSATPWSETWPTTPTAT